MNIDSANPFELIHRGESNHKVIVAIAAAKPQDLIKYALQTPEDHIPTIGSRVASEVNSRGAHAIICTGYFLEGFRVLTNRQEFRETFQQMLETIGISQSHAYAAMAVARELGRPLLAEPELAKQFAAESLKILASERVSLAAREMAFELARQGERVTIAEARRICRQHGATIEVSVQSELQCDDELSGREACPGSSTSTNLATAPRTNKDRSTSDRSSNSRKTNVPLWRFVGRCVRLVVEPANPTASDNIEAIIADLEAAVAEFRHKYAATELVHEEVSRAV